MALDELFEDAERLKLKFVAGFASSTSPWACVCSSQHILSQSRVACTPMSGW
jgi:hypothetical protein